MKKLFSLFIGMFLFLSCTHSCATKTQQENPEARVIYQSDYGGTGVDEFQIIDSQDEFNTYWGNTTFQPIESAPKIDFKKEMVIVKNFKSQQSGGNVYRFESIQFNEDLLNINYSISSSDGMVTQAITNPLMVIVVDKINNPTIKFQKI